MAPNTGQLGLTAVEHLSFPTFCFGPLCSRHPKHSRPLPSVGGHQKSKAHPALGIAVPWLLSSLQTDPVLQFLLKPGVDDEFPFSREPKAAAARSWVEYTSFKWNFTGKSKSVSVIGSFVYQDSKENLRAAFFMPDKHTWSQLMSKVKAKPLRTNDVNVPYWPLHLVASGSFLLGGSMYCGVLPDRKSVV